MCLLTLASHNATTNEYVRCAHYYTIMLTLVFSRSHGGRAPSTRRLGCVTAAAGALARGCRMRGHRNKMVQCNGGIAMSRNEPQ